MTADLDPTATADAAAWEIAAAAVLKKSGKDIAPDAVRAALSRTTAEGITVAALGTPATVADVPATGVPGAAPFLRGSAPGPHDWDIRAQLFETDPTRAATVALEELTGGATSLWLTLGSGGLDPDQLPAVLAEVYLDLAPIVLSPNGSALPGGKALAAVAADRGALHPHSNLGADPLREPQPGEIVRLAEDLGIRAFTVDGTRAHLAWAGDAAELGWATAVGVQALRDLEAAGVDIDRALALLEFRLAATDDQFPTIAKFRAARLLWDRVAELCGAGPDRPGQRQHAVTSWPMTTRYDPYTNLLRTTVAAFAAGVGGADAVTVLPFDTALGIPDALGRRMARNISHLLVGESHVTATADPAGGSHAVERLTWDLAETAWAEFQQIEAAGGARAALEDGAVTARWAAAASDRQRALDRRKQPLTGVSEFPRASEVLPERRPGSDLGPRWATAYEELRDTPPAADLFLATLGPVAAHTARATFVLNALTAGGISAAQAGPTTGVEDVLSAYAGQGVVCLAGTDSAYAEQGVALVAALREAGAHHVLLAGRPGPDLADLVDDHVAVGVDLIAFLERTRAALNATPRAEETR